MQPFQIKTITLRRCRRCRETWNTEREELEPGDKINIVIVGIAYCPACAQSFAAETDEPRYERRTNKRIR